MKKSYKNRLAEGIFVGFGIGVGAGVMKLLLNNSMTAIESILKSVGL